jgi:hypothetical protein
MTTVNAYRSLYSPWGKHELQWQLAGSVTLVASWLNYYSGEGVEIPSIVRFGRLTLAAADFGSCDWGVFLTTSSAELVTSPGVWLDEIYPGEGYDHVWSQTTGFTSETCGGLPTSASDLYLDGRGICLIDRLSYCPKKKNPDANW